MKIHSKPTLLIILDGWGHSESTQHNAIATAHTPTWDALMAKYPHRLITASGTAVGLPHGQIGNSEVGHMHMGAGRLVDQTLTTINKAIVSGEFARNQTLVQTLQSVKQSGSAFHIMGLLSPGGVHSHEEHIKTMITCAANHGLNKVFLHLFLDGRDTPPRSALASIEALEAHCHSHHCGQIASLVGRYYAMDRDERWDRTQAAFQLIVNGQAVRQAQNASAALKTAYDHGENDEFVQATKITGTHQPVQTGDTVILMNFRADRAIQLTRAFVDANFSGFARVCPKIAAYVTLASLGTDITGVHTLFPPKTLKNCLGEVLCKHGLKQLRIAETEKYAHVTYFFNGGRKAPFDNEERILIPSPQVATYDLAPEMHAPQLTRRLVDEIHKGQFDAIICNFANPDMVGHSGNFAATITAIETIDDCLASILKAQAQVGGETLITADHGNAECLFNPETGQAHTAHTTSLVPLIYIGRKAKFDSNEASLADIAPTILYLMAIEQPQEMTGRALLTLT